jgi:hypothetical protein
MTDWEKLSDDAWLQVNEFVLGPKGANPNAPVRHSRSTWLTMVKKGQAPMGRGQGPNRVWRWGDIKEWAEEWKRITTPKSEEALLKELDPQDARKTLSPYDVAMGLLCSSEVKSVVITKAPLGGFTFTINKTKGKPINYWVRSRTAP